MQRHNAVHKVQWQEQWSALHCSDDDGDGYARYAKKSLAEVCYNELRVLYYIVCILRGSCAHSHKLALL